MYFLIENYIYISTATLNQTNKFKENTTNTDIGSHSYFNYIVLYLCVYQINFERHLKLQQRIYALNINQCLERQQTVDATNSWCRQQKLHLH